MTFFFKKKFWGKPKKGDWYTPVSPILATNDVDMDAHILDVSESGIFDGTIGVKKDLLDNLRTSYMENKDLKSDVRHILDEAYKDPLYTIELEQLVKNGDIELVRTFILNNYVPRTTNS